MTTQSILKHWWLMNNLQPVFLLHSNSLPHLWEFLITLQALVLKLCLSLWARGYIVALFNFRSHLQIIYRSCFAIPGQAPVSVQTWASVEITSYANMHWESHSANHLTPKLPVEQHIDFDLPGKVGRRTLSGLSLLGSSAPTGGQCEAGWCPKASWTPATSP